MPKGKLLARGRTAEIYTWDEGQVLKRFLPGWDHQDAAQEYKNARAAQLSGVAVPHVYDLIEQDGQPAIVYEYIEGQTILQALQKRIWLFPRFARRMAELHLEMHQREAGQLRKQSHLLAQKIRHAIGLEEDVKAKLLDHAQQLPDDNRLLHGDFHVNNLMLSPSGAMIIDWVDASSGHPLADVARTVVLSTMSAIPKDFPGRRSILIIRSLFNRIYLSRYFQNSSHTPQDLHAWLVPLVAARLSENIVEERARLSHFVDQNLPFPTWAS